MVLLLKVNRLWICQFSRINDYQNLAAPPAQWQLLSPSSICLSLGTASKSVLLQLWKSTGIKRETFIWTSWSCKLQALWRDFRHAAPRWKLELKYLPEDLRGRVQFEFALYKLKDWLGEDLILFKSFGPPSVLCMLNILIFHSPDNTVWSNCNLKSLSILFL